MSRVLCVTREEILEGELNDYEGIVIRSRLTIDARLLAALSSLKWIARSGSGLDNIDKRKPRLEESKS